MYNKATLKRIAEAAVEAARGTKCPARMVGAQAGAESGWLDNSPGNNCLGIKEYSGCHGTQLLHTTEWFTDTERGHFLLLGHGRMANLVYPIQTDFKGRKKYAVQDLFATFADLSDCLKKRVALFDAGPYKRFAQSYDNGGSLENLIRGMASVYATDKRYGEVLWSIVNQRDFKAAFDAAESSTKA